MNELLIILAGIFLSIMITLNGLLTSYLNVFEISLIVHFIGMILLMIYIKIIQREAITIGGVPIVMYSVGLLGVFLIAVNSFCFNIIGVTLTIAYSLMGQIIISALIDHFGLFGIKKVPFRMARLSSFMIICIGLLLLVI